MYCGQGPTPLLLERAAGEVGDRPLLICDDISLTYSQALAEVRKLANGIEELGVRRGDCVMVLLETGVEYPLLLFALHALGALSINLNTLYTSEELQFVFAESRPAAIVTSASLAPNVRTFRGDTPLIVVGPAKDREIPWASLFSHGGDGPLLRRGVLSTDPATVIYTSGTTSRPKGVMLSQGSHCLAGEYLSRNIGLRAGEKYYCILPLFHSNALQNGLFPMITVRGTLFLKRFSVSSFVDDIVRHEITYTSGGAPHWRMVLAHLAKEGRTIVEGSALRIALSGMPMTDEEYEAFEKAFGCRIVEIFGLTEGVVPTTLQSPYSPPRRRSGGKAGLGSEIRIRHSDGHIAEGSAPGEIELRTYALGGVTLGYLNQPERTAELFTEDGWLRTSDLGYIDEDGSLMFLSRIKDMIKVGGENVAASEVERVLADHPSVLEAAVVAISDPLLGQVVGAYVVPANETTPSEEDLLAFCAQKLARFKVPRRVAIIGSLPRNALDKVVKSELPAL